MSSMTSCSVPRSLFCRRQVCKELTSAASFFHKAWHCIPETLPSTSCANIPSKTISLPPHESRSRQHLTFADSLERQTKPFGTIVPRDIWANECSQVVNEESPSQGPSWVSLSQPIPLHSMQPQRRAQKGIPLKTAFGFVHLEGL